MRRGIQKAYGFLLLLAFPQLDILTTSQKDIDRQMCLCLCLALLELGVRAAGVRHGAIEKPQIFAPDLDQADYGKHKTGLRSTKAMLVF